MMLNRTAQCFWLAAAIMAASLAAPGPAAAQVAVFVNGAPITNYDVEQRSKFTQLSPPHKAPSRQEVLNELIEEKVKTQEAARYSMEMPKDEIDRGITNMASRGGLNMEQFTQLLASKGIDVETVRHRMRADLAWGQLVRARFPATLSVEEKEIRDAVEKKGGEGEAAAYDYRLRQILFIVPKGSPRPVIDGRIREAEALRSRFENCDSGIALARTLRDVAVREPVRKSSTDLPDNLRDILNNTPIGKLTKPEENAQGVAVFALCERQQNTADTLEKRKAKAELFNARYDAVSKRYLNDVRRSAIIEYK